MPHAALDIRFHSNPKILTAGNAAAGLYARALSYCADNLTDGFVTDAWARSAGKPAETKRLVDGGLFVKVDGGYSIPDYLDFNFSRQRVEEIIEQKREAGKKGAKARWGDSSSHGKQVAGAMAGAMANGWQSDGPSTQFPNPSPTESQKQLKQFTAEPEIKHEIERILPLLHGVDEGSPGVIAAEARGLPLGALAKVRESVTEKTKQDGSVGPGWVVNALKAERVAIEAAASLRQAKIDDDIPFATEAA